MDLPDWDPSPGAPPSAPAIGSASGGDAPAAVMRVQGSEVEEPSTFVFIKRSVAGPADDEVYAELNFLPGDTVARLAARACAKFGWGTPSQAHLFLVVHPPGGDEPPAQAEAMAPSGQRLQSGWTLERAGVKPNSWLLARVPAPAAASAAVVVPAPAAQSSPALQSLASVHSDAVEAEAAVAFLQLVHAAFPSAHLMDLPQPLVGKTSQPVANRVFSEREFGDTFRRGRAAFVAATLAVGASLRPPVDVDALDFSAGAKYAGRDFDELEADCIVKLPPSGLAEWTLDASATAESGGRLFFVAPAGARQRLPDSAAPATLRADAGRGGSRFSTEHYPPGATAYVLAEVYAPLGGRAAQQQAQKLLQAERLLQFLVAKEGVVGVRDVVLGFVFMGPHMDASAAARLHATLAHYREALPCLWALQGGGATAGARGAPAEPAGALPAPLPCRLLACRLASAQPALTAMRVERIEEDVREIKRLVSSSRCIIV